MGNPPFKADTLQATLMKHKYEAPPAIKEINPKVPDEVQRIVMKALSKDVAMRYQKIQEMVTDINKFRGVKSTDDVAEKKEKEEGVVQEKTDFKKKIFKKIILILLVLLIGLGIFFRANIFWFFSDFSAKIPIPFFKKGDDVVGRTKQDLKKMSSADKHYNAGLKYFADGEIDLAIGEYEKALRLRKDYGAYYKDLAIAYEEKGEIKKAISALNNLLKYDHSGTFAESAILHLDKLNAKLK